ncbi:MAG: lytic polysaccharide monooxygenase [bacterium]|nr:lytic polysaccharide monooxygenase [bacterium]
MTCSPRALLSLTSIALSAAAAFAHGTVVEPVSRVYRVYQSNPENPSFPLAQNAVAIDGTLSYYTWNELSRNIPEAVQAGLPPGFDYSPWVPDGQLASGGRVDPNSPDYPRTYAGLDQVSPDWPKTPVQAGATITVDFLATAPHDPSVWDVWMTTPDWNPSTALNWAQMEFLGRPQVTFTGSHYLFDLPIPTNRTGHHVLWVAWHRADPVGEVFFSTSDLMIEPPLGTTYCSPNTPNSTGQPGAIAVSGSALVAENDLQLEASALPPFQFGYFLCSMQEAQTPFPGGSEGILCLANPIGRFSSQVQNSGANGTFAIDVDLTALPLSPPVAALPGERWNFQAWYRDALPTPTSNFTDAIGVTFQ